MKQMRRLENPWKQKKRKRFFFLIRSEEGIFFCFFERLTAFVSRSSEYLYRLLCVYALIRLWQAKRAIEIHERACERSS